MAVATKRFRPGRVRPVGGRSTSSPETSTVSVLRMSCRRRADQQLERAGLDAPPCGVDVVEGERPLVEREPHPFGCSRLEVHLRERAQLAIRSVHGRVDVANVELDDVAARSAPGVRHRDLDGEIAARARDGGIAPTELGVRPAVPEREARSHLGGVVEPIPDVEPLPILDLSFASGEVLLGREHHRRGEALGQAPAGLGVADEDVDDRAAGRLTTEVGLDDGRRSIGPGEQHRRAVDEHHHRARVRRTHRGDQFVVRWRQGQRGAVASLRLVDRRETDEHDRHRHTAGEVDGLPEPRRIGPTGHGVVTNSEADPAGETFLGVAAGIVEPRRHHLGTSGSLIPRVLGERCR